MSPMINRDFTYLVVGASRDPHKYGHRVFKDLLKGGYKVHPVNPAGGELLGEKVYAKVGDYEESIDVAIMVVPALVGEGLLDEILDKGIKNVWFQPGSESGLLLQKCRNLGLEYSAGKCIMIERHKL